MGGPTTSDVQRDWPSLSFAVGLADINGIIE